jgi:hypothetical protein
MLPLVLMEVLAPVENLVVVMVVVAAAVTIPTEQMVVMVVPLEEEEEVLEVAMVEMQQELVVMGLEGK